MTEIFFSYSHADEALRDRLETHLSVLKRSGVIDTWHDRRMAPGDRLDPMIDSAIERANVVLLLVSADFLASDYCFGREMGRALEREANGEVRVIPIILRPCDWKDTPIGKLVAIPRDGKPVSKFTDPEEAWAEVSAEIRRIVTGGIAPSAPRPLATGGASSKLGPSAANAPRSSQLAIRREFSRLDRDTFLADAFDYMARFFENSLEELGRREHEVVTRFLRITAQKFMAAIYRDGQLLSQCWISTGGGVGYGGNGIRYSSSESANSYNEELTVSDDGYGQFMKTLGLQFGIITSNVNRERLSDEAAAEFYWNLLLARLR